MNEQKNQLTISVNEEYKCGNAKDLQLLRAQRWVVQSQDT